MPVLTKDERARCLEQGDAFGNAFLCFDTEQVLVFRPRPSGGIMILLKTMALAFIVLALSVIPAYLMAPPAPKDFWIYVIGPPLFLGLAFVILRAAGAWAEVRLTASGFEVCLYKGLSKNGTVLEGAWADCKGFSMKDAGEGGYSVILEVQRDVVLAVGRMSRLDPACQRLLHWIEQRRRG